jgi:hypothetical protein
MRYHDPELDIAREALNTPSHDDGSMTLRYILLHTTNSVGTKNSVNC